MDGHPSPDTGDRKLLERLRYDDESALEALVLRYYEPLVTLTIRYVHSIDLAEDVVQSLFIRLWERRGHWNVRTSSVRVYLFSAARNAARDAIASGQARNRAEARGYMPSDPPSPDALLEDEELQQRIARVVDTLPDRCREIYLLARDHGMRFVEIAEVLGIAPSTVRTQMGRALAILQKEIVPYLVAALVISGSS